MIHNIFIDLDSTEFVSTDSSKYAYKTIVKLNVTKKDGYDAVIKIKDENGNSIEVNDNKFMMPDSDVTISVTYQEAKNPKTGDCILICFGLLIISSATLIGFKIRSKRKRLS